MAQLAKSIRHPSITPKLYLQLDELININEKKSITSLKTKIYTSFQKKFAKLIQHGITHQDLHAANVGILVTKQTIHIYFLDWDDAFEIKAIQDKHNKEFGAFVKRQHTVLKKYTDKVSKKRLQQKKHQLHTEINKLMNAQKQKFNEWQMEALSFKEKKGEMYIPWETLFSHKDTFLI